MDWGRSIEAVDAVKQQHKEWRHEADNWRAVKAARHEEHLPNRAVPKRKSILQVLSETLSLLNRW